MWTKFTTYLISASLKRHCAGGRKGHGRQLVRECKFQDMAAGLPILKNLIFSLKDTFGGLSSNILLKEETHVAMKGNEVCWYLFFSTGLLKYRDGA